jgi:hypothetical protein
LKFHSDSFQPTTALMEKLLIELFLHIQDHNI